jgi:hypothetical protein
MPKVMFSGRVHPPVFSVTLKRLPSVVWKQLETGLELQIAMNIENNDIIADCTINRELQNGELASVYARVRDIADASIDLVAFKLGTILSVSFEKVTNSDGATTSIAITEPSLSAECTSYQFTTDSTDFAEVLKAVIGDPAISVVLRDLIDAVARPHRSIANCGRAIEAAMQLVSPAGTSRLNGMINFYTYLNLSPDFVKLITEAARSSSDAPTEIADDVRKEITRRSWAVVNRLLEFRKRGSERLPTSEFPTL